jgi:hypothetical protein
MTQSPNVFEAVVTELRLQRLGFDLKHQNPTLEAVVQFFKLSSASSFLKLFYLLIENACNGSNEYHK